MQSARIGKYLVSYENAEEFNEIRKEVWTKHAYYTDGIEPKLIVDAGAHIGLVSLYFAQIYPKARILAYEPDRQNFALLTKNIQENQLTQVSCINAAIAPKSGEITLQEPIFTNEWRSGVRIVCGGWRGVLHTRGFLVLAVGINQILPGVDLIKMDIEGMEYEVLERAELNEVKTIMVEVHPRKGKQVAKIEKKLQKAGFEIERKEDSSRWGKGLSLIVARRV